MTAKAGSMGVAWLAGVLPLATIHLCYLVSAAQQKVPWCFPYGMDCVSISAGGREGLAWYLFKLLMLPSALCIGGFWWLVARRLSRAGEHGWRKHLMLGLGLVAVTGLIFYTLALGAIGEEYRMIRRTGVILFFGFSYLAQLLLLVLLGHTEKQFPPLRGLLQKLQWLAWLILGLMILAVSLSAINNGFYDRVENAFEWTAASLLCVFVWLEAGVLDGSN